MKILVLGATGMLGHMACRVLSVDHDVSAVFRSSSANCCGITNVIPAEACFPNTDCTGDLGQLALLLDTLAPDVVLNALGIVKQRAEATDPIESIRINALFPHQLARVCDMHDARLIQISTDCVFSGVRGAYEESDTPDPVDLYGRSKLLGEVLGDRHLTIRTSIIGPQPNGNTGLVAWLCSQRKGKIEGYVNAVFSGLTTHALCETINCVLQRSQFLSGLYHVASPAISKFELLDRLNKALNLDIEIIRNTSFSCDRSLDDSLFRETTGIMKPSWTDMIDQLTSDLFCNEYTDKRA